MQPPLPPFLRSDWETPTTPRRSFPPDFIKVNTTHFPYPANATELLVPFPEHAVGAGSKPALPSAGTHYHLPTGAVGASDPYLEALSGHREGHGQGVRLGSDLHAAVVIAAKAEQMSINSWIVGVLREAIAAPPGGFERDGSGEVRKSVIL